MMSTETAPTTLCQTVRANRVRIVLGVCCALALGFGVATAGSALISDLARAALPEAETLPAVAQSTADTQMLGQLAADLNDLAPAAGAPLGTLSE